MIFPPDSPSRPRVSKSIGRKGPRNLGMAEAEGNAATDPAAKLYPGSPMSAPFSQCIIGSWLFVHSDRPDFTGRFIYHFTKKGTCCIESDNEGLRHLSHPALMSYRITNDVLTLIYTDGKSRDFILVQENNGTVRFPAIDGFNWWMKRLTKPEEYSRAFVDESGDGRVLPAT